MPRAIAIVVVLLGLAWHTSPRAASGTIARATSTASADQVTASGATKPLSITLSVPRSLSPGDVASFSAVVTNTGAPGDGLVTIRSLDPTILKFDDADQIVEAASGGSAAVSFSASARLAGVARVRISVTIGKNTDTVDTTVPIAVQSHPETIAAYGDTTDRADELILLPRGVVPTRGGLTIDLSSTALVGLGESARFLDTYPYDSAEQKASRALALLLANDLGGAFAIPDMAPTDYRAQGVAALSDLYHYQCGDGAFALWPGQCLSTSAYLTSYVLHVMQVAETLKVTLDRTAINRALDYLEQQLRQPPPDDQWLPVWAASQAYAVKVLAEFGRNPTADVTRLVGLADRTPMPIFALSYLADALAATGDRGVAYQAIRFRVTSAIRIEADQAHVESLDGGSLAWLWDSRVHTTAVVLEGLARRKDADAVAPQLARWLLAARQNGRWSTTHDNAAALEALVSYSRTVENDVPNMTATVVLGTLKVGSASLKGSSTAVHQLQVAMPELLKQLAGSSRELVITRSGTGRVYFETRLQYLAPIAPLAVDRGMHVDRQYGRVAEDGTTVMGTGASFSAGDFIRVTVGVTLPMEGKYLALTDPLPAGVEAVEGWFETTAMNLARVATTQSGANDWTSWWRRGGFDFVEKHDDRVNAFATRLSAGRHEFSYLVRATASGTFTATGTWVELMYTPEVTARSAATTIRIK